MLNTIQDLAFIQKLNDQFITQIKLHQSETYTVRIGWPAGTRSCVVNYFPAFGFWIFSEINYDNPSMPKYLHALGSGKLKENQSLSAPCQINFPTNLKSRVSGAFAADENAQVCILHTGKIFGYSQADFWQSFRNQKVDAMHLGKVKTYALVGTLGDSELMNQIAGFVKEIEYLKRLRS